MSFALWLMRETALIKYLQNYAATPLGENTLIWAEKKRKQSWSRKAEKSEIFKLEETFIWKVEVCKNVQLHNRLLSAAGNHKQCLPLLKNSPFNLIRAGAERSDVPCYFSKVTGKNPRNQEVFMISIDFQFSWFICSLSDRLMLVYSKLYVEFALIRCLCNRH